MRKTKEVEPTRIEDFIQSVLALNGLKRGRDFKVSGRQLWIKKKPLRGKLIVILKNTFPEYSYYWESPQILRWF